MLDIEAESSYKACDKAIADLSELCRQSPIQATAKAEEWQEPLNWSKEAERMALSAMSDYSLDDAVKEAAAKCETVDDAYEEIYQGRVGDQSHFLSDISNELADGTFIYNSSDALKEAMDCIDELQEYASGDDGLWQGQTDYAAIIQIQATDALSGAITAELEVLCRAALSEIME